MIGTGAGIAIAGGIGALGSLGGGIYGSSKARKASKKAAEIQWAMFQQSRADLAPWRQSGEEALNEYMALAEAGPGEFEADPGYQFRLEQGQKAIERSALAKGNFLSGRTAKGLQEFGQQSASAEYGNFMNRYYKKLDMYGGVARMGLSAAQGQAGAAMQTGQNLSSNYLNTGANLANIGMGAAAGLSNALSLGVMGQAGPQNVNQLYGQGQDWRRNTQGPWS